MKTLYLKGVPFLIDSEDFERISVKSWYLHKDGYAETHSPRVSGKQGAVGMHREVLRLKPGDGILVDHINGNPRDNRKSNLRICTHSQNMANRKMQHNNKSGYRGVRWSKEDKKWRATIQVNGIKIHLGMFTDLVEAALSYNQAAKEHFGEFAVLNKVKRAGI